MVLKPLDAEVDQRHANYKFVNDAASLQDDGIHFLISTDLAKWH
jgi:hypothetical protein